MNETQFDIGQQRYQSISVIERLTDNDIMDMMKHVHRCLKPGGLFILTIDLFLNLHPFVRGRKMNLDEIEMSAL
jgi:hypothetical protein